MSAEESQSARLAKVMSSALSTLVADFEFVDLAYELAQSTVQLLDANAAGVMLEDRSGRLQVVSASDEETRVLELFELQRAEGPCFECWHTGELVSEPDIDAEDRWPAFLREARELGFVSAIAVPLRLRGRVVGALNVFWRSRHQADGEELAAAQALADIAVVGLLQQRLAEDSHVLAEQLEVALQSRILIEQAKGVVAIKADVTVDEAFDILREYSSREHQSLVRVARAVVDRSLEWRESALHEAVSG